MTTYILRRFVLIGALWVFSALLAAAQPHFRQPGERNVSVPSEGDSVPLLDFGGRPVVDVMINGKGPYQFIFDTGASMTVIDSSVADELALEPGAAIQELRIGNVTIRDADEAVVPLSQMFGSDKAPRGILSASAFPGNLVSFDYPRKRLLIRPGKLEEANARSIFAYDPADLPSVPVKVAGHELSVHLDTGAPYAVALPTKYMSELPLAAPAKQKGKAKTHAGFLPVFQASLNGDISIGDYKVQTRDLHFTDVVPYGGAEPRGQVGNQALQGLIVTLDSKNHRIRFEKPAR